MDWVTLAVFEGASKEAAVVQKLPNDLRKLRRFFDRWAKRGEIHTCYEASGAGYVLYHELTEWGHDCEIIAPSLTPIRPGEQRKHDLTSDSASCEPVGHDVDIAEHDAGPIPAPGPRVHPGQTRSRPCGSRIRPGTRRSFAGRGPPIQRCGMDLMNAPPPETTAP